MRWSLLILAAIIIVLVMAGLGMLSTVESGGQGSSGDTNGGVVIAFFAFVDLIVVTVLNVVLALMTGISVTDTRSTTWKWLFAAMALLSILGPYLIFTNFHFFTNLVPPLGSYGFRSGLPLAVLLLLEPVMALIYSFRAQTDMR